MKNKDNKVCKGMKIPDCFSISPLQEEAK